MVNDCFTVAVFCVCAAILAVLLRRYCCEQSMLISVAACAAIVGGFLIAAEPVIDEIEQLFADSGISSSYITLIFKALAICFITQITGDICRDSGETAIAAAADIWCRGSITAMSLPIIKALIETISDFL